MARRANHSARHRAGRLQQDAPGEGIGAARAELAGAGLASAELPGTGLAESGLAEPVLAQVAPEEAGGQGAVTTAATAATAATSGARPAEPELAPDRGARRPGQAAPGPGEGARGPGGGARRPGAGARRPGPAAKPRKLGRPRLTAKRILLACAVVVLIVAGMISIGPTGATVPASVKTFLYDWETGNYRGAAALTTGNQAVVKKALRAAFRQLGAEDLVLGMGPITVGSSTATAYFQATVDLGRGLLPWQYEGHFRLTRVGSAWRVVWSPSVITPGLGPHDRLAVITTMPGRAPLLDTAGRSLISLSRVYEVGVVPDKVAHPAATAAAFARATGLPESDVDQIRGQIEAWPAHEFLGLVQLSAARYQRVSGELAEIGGVTHVVVRRRLFNSTVPAVTGLIGTETASVIAKEGEPYRPGTTVGETGLEKEYQAQLAGAPSTSVVVQDRAGKLVRVLHRWPGQPGTPLRTTIDGGIQKAAQSVLLRLPAPDSAAIVATRAGGGQILAVASRRAGGLPAVDPLDGPYQPAQTFTIVSTAALLSSTPVGISSLVPCKSTNPVGGQVFSKLAPSPRFSADFMHACRAAFVGLSLRLSASALTSAAKGFGIGSTWRLPLPHPVFDGSIAVPGNIRDKASDVVGLGSVQVSPLGMALAAGVVDSGTWLAPELVSSPSQKPAKRVVFGRVIGSVRKLMLQTVTAGAARPAYRPGEAIYGQVGSAPLARHSKLFANWFVGFRGNVAFAVLIISTSNGFSQPAELAGQFAASLPPGSFGRG